ncbi:sensor histidine kinase [Luteolibacter luteus]|uniref:histidine kinase n=1 Tax=Luteolibacter luteus TaxID=2728835 RepID=A0A858RCZ9_9BACT|nr:ATP-binding protein [Luteolibacter luteus]QJE94269.1 hypothetical protein HHL09_00200 [Luteolibacter luteus]
MNLTVALAVGYFLLGRLAFAMAVSEGSATSIAFLPEGLALAFTIIFGPRVSLGIFLGQLVLSVSLGVPAAVGAAFGLVNAIGDSIGGWLFWKWRISPSLGRPRDVVRLFAMIALVLQPASALAKALPRMSISVPEEVIHLSIYSWAGNTMGQFLLVPILLTWCSAGLRFDRRELVRSSAILGLYGAGILMFSYFRLGEIDRLYWFAVFGGFYLVLIWSSVQSGTLVTSAINFLITMGFVLSIAISPESLLYFSTQGRVLYADFLILAGVASSLVISALCSQLREKTAQLIQANRAKEQLLAIIGHDVRSPIASLSTALDLVKEGRMEQSEFFSIKKQLRLATDSTRWTLENIMEWATLQLDELKPAPMSCRVLAMAEDAVELLRVNAEFKAIKVVIDIDGDAMVWADRHHLGSILRNLLSNAIKFTGRGGRVRLSASRAGGSWRITVEDNGVGMTSQQTDGLFEEGKGFSTSVGTARERGAGLGLQIVSSFLDANGGDLSVDSLPNEGSAFHFTLPLPPESSL